ncbi:hypothetical protein PBI_KEPLER_63 [Arthrobacter phage Kepler]|uniref:Uncharacterized protein n=1 Tax=Arthrobacter phage Kepler TaxID=2419959 RepID=A0A3G2KH32_9CAUD|nr:hypothetical protein HOU55_gp63 [Arthrobacter phage Kepler]AYN58289.1 hypothetical protein PBI_KEPLER_63 [Arthrobacter phage Kepler]
MKSCGECEWQGPELPGPAAAREIHRALHGLGRRFLEALDPIVAAFVPIKPLENLDAPDFPGPGLAGHAECSRGYAGWVADSRKRELRLVMGGKVVGSAILDGSSLHGEVLDPVAVEDLRRGLLGGVSIGPEFNLNEVRFRGEPELFEAMQWPGRMLARNLRAVQEEMGEELRPAVPEGLSVRTEFCHYHGFGDCRTSDCEPLP